MSRQPDRGDAGEPTQVRAAIKDLALVGTLVAIVCAGLAAWSWWSAPRRSDSTTRARRVAGRDDFAFVGDSTCRQCHPAESAAHRRSGHSRTLRRAADDPLGRTLHGATVRDKEFNATWTFAVEDGAFTATRTEDGKPARYDVDYLFGSGQHGTTFVSLTDRTPSRPGALEHRISYFADRGQLDTTPGQSRENLANPEELTPTGRVLGAEKTLQCFGCHATILSATALEELDTASMIPNISCERCHGPGRDHTQAARRHARNLKMPFGPDASTAEQQMRHCGFCHRHPDTIPASSIRPDNAPLARFQPVGLMQSKCYTRTSGGLACTVCHDSHARAAENRGSYENACLECHTARPQVVCATNATTGCITCHMPLRDSGTGAWFHDHWIRRPDPPERSASGPEHAVAPPATR